MANKILTGHNSNEVILVDKSKKNQGFWKFFNFELKLYFLVTLLFCDHELGNTSIGCQT